MVKIVRVSFPPLWQNIGTVLLLITNDRRVVTMLLHQTKQGILLLARKSGNFNTHAHLNTTVMMHFQSRFQYTSTGRMDKLRAPDKVYPCGRYGIWIESASLQVLPCTRVQMRMRNKISTFPRQQKDPLLCLMQKPCYYPSIIRN